tara:strand:+ start:4657 stop:5037 length:381 start_codon:yes stop_codon:yes gene_type:complete
MEKSQIALEAEFDACLPLLLAELDEWYVEETEAIDAGIVGAAPAGTGGSMMTVGPAIDSKRVLDASAVTRSVIGIDIAPEIIRPGGYASKRHLLDHLIPQLRKVYSGERKVKKRREKKPMVEVTNV